MDDSDVAYYKFGAEFAFLLLRLVLASCVEPTGDIQPRDSDSLTNFFEYPDTSSCTPEKCEEPMNDDDSTSRRILEDDLPTSLIVTEEAGPQKESDASLENVDKGKATGEEDLSYEDDRKLQEPSETEQRETKDYQEEGRASDTDMHMHDHDDLRSEEMVSTDAEAGPVQVAKGSYEGWKHVDERKPNEEDKKLSHETDRKLKESPEAEQRETKENEEDRRTSDTDMHIHERLQPEEMVATDAPVAESAVFDAAVLRSFEPTEITEVQNKSGPVSPPGCELTGAASQSGDEVGGVGTAAEWSAVETRPEVAETMRDSEIASLAVPVSLPTTAPDAVEKMDDLVQLVSVDGAEAAHAVLESAVANELGVADHMDEDKKSELAEAEQDEKIGDESEFRGHDKLCYVLLFDVRSCTLFYIPVYIVLLLSSSYLIL